MSILYAVSPILGYIKGPPFLVILSITLFYTAEDIFNQLNIIYFNEISNNKLRSRVPLVWTFKAFGSIAINFILLYIPDYRDFFLLALCVCISYIIFVPFVIESPYFAFKSGDLRKYFDVIKDIGKRNSKDENKI